MIYSSKSVRQTQNIAADSIKRMNTLKAKGATVVALEGELGAGKTVFVKGLAKALGINEKIKSPTFVLIKKYKIPKTGQTLFHLDCYRLRDENDLIILGVRETLQASHNIVVIEWSDRVKKILPKKHIKVHIDHISKTERKISIKM